jgi:hypothetical protein
MSDIVKKLRDLEQWIREPEGESFTLHFDLFDEAANEMERLYAEKERLRKALATYACRCGDGECYKDEFVASCGRSAREALGLILNANSLPYAQEIAAKALEEKK